ncbi:MAG: COX15/CtaA family protein [Rhodothermales bacterium]
MTTHPEPLGEPATEMTWRHRFTVLTAGTTVLLFAWGAFVTSINAGLAVPDWPSSFNSYDPFNPWPEWWRLTPVLAEHGHRLVGALVGILTLILAVWTWIADSRRWMKYLSVGALLLVSLQGTLGGLRVVLLSLDLAVVHACIAQVFFGLIVALALFTSRPWLTGDRGTYEASDARGMRRTAWLTVAVLYVQIILGALLRHPGTGIDPMLAGLHILGAIITTAAIILLFRRASARHRGTHLLYPAARWMVVLVAIQFALGLTAFVVTLDDSGMLDPSNLQVVVNTAHMVTGALLMGCAVAAAVDATRLGRDPSNEKYTDPANSVILQQPSLSR